MEGLGGNLGLDLHKFLELITSTNGVSIIQAVTMLRVFWRIEARLGNIIRLQVYCLQHMASQVQVLEENESVVRLQELEVPLEHG